MNVLLIHPRVPSSKSVFRHALTFLRRSLLPPPTGLLRAGTRLPRSWRKRLVDLNASRLTNRWLRWSDCAIVYGERYQRFSAWAVALRCRVAGLRVFGCGQAFHAWQQRIGLLSGFCHTPAEADWSHLCSTKVSPRRTSAPSNTEAHDDSWDPIDFSRYSDVAVHWMPEPPCAQGTDVSSVLHELDDLKSMAPRDWKGTVHVMMPDSEGDPPAWTPQIASSLHQWRETHSGVTFRAEIPLAMLSERSSVSQLVDAGVREAFLRIEPSDLASPSIAAGGRVHLVRWIKRAQRMGLQIRGGLPILRGSGGRFEALSVASRIRKLQLTKVLTCVLHAPLGRIHLLPAIRSIFRAGLPLRSTARILGVGMHSLFTNPKLFSLALTLAIYSEHYFAVGGHAA